jgi:SP family xylose:H+ symportor-like MFS transporter
MDRSSALNAAFNHGFAYWMYGVFGVIAALFVMRFVPETKQRSLEQIQNMWATREDQRIHEEAPAV